MEAASSSTTAVEPASKASSFKRLTKDPSVSTPSKPTEGKKNKRLANNFTADTHSEYIISASYVSYHEQLIQLKSLA